MTTAYDVSAQELIETVGRDLKENVDIEAPDWSNFVKTGVNKERRPENPDWWWMRAASILRKVYMKGPIGVEKLRSEYGGAKNRGSKPERFNKASGKIIRTALQKLDDAGLTEKKEKEGRIVTAKGQSYLDNIAKEIEKQ